MSVGYQEITLKPGQFIFGRKVASIELKMSERTVRTCLHSLEKTQNVTIKTTNKFSIISIVNWSIYQQEQTQNDQQNDQQVTSNRPASDQQVTTNKNSKNIKKVKKEITAPRFISESVWESFKTHRKSIKAPLTEDACSLIFKKLEKWQEEYGYSPDDVLNQSIENGWKGIFEINNNGNKGKKDTWDEIKEWAKEKDRENGIYGTSDGTN